MKVAELFESVTKKKDFLHSLRKMWREAQLNRLVKNARRRNHDDDARVAAKMKMDDDNKCLTG